MHQQGMSEGGSSPVSSKNPELKIVLVGDGGVGKTSLLSAYYTKVFEDFQKPTVAPTFCTVNIELEGRDTVKLNVWDTAGQERYRSLSTQYIRNADIAFVCFDYKDKLSVDHLEEWFNAIYDECPDCITFLVGCKCDLLKFDEDASCQSLAGSKAQLNKARCYVLTSAKTGAGIEMLFHEAAACYKSIVQMPSTESILDSPERVAPKCKC